MAHLMIHTGPARGRAFELGDSLTIGRDESCDLVLDDSLVSRQHLRIWATEAGYLIEDLGSTNGTWLNGARVARSPLRPGDELCVGETTMTLEGAGAKTPTGATVVVGKTRSTIQAAVSATDRGPAKADTTEDLHRRLDLFLQVGEALGSAVSVGELFERMLDELFRVFDQAERGFVIVTERPQGPYRVVASRSLKSRPEQVTLSHTIIEHALTRHEAVLSSDAAADERFSEAQSIIAHGIRSVICAPLVYGDEVLGAVHVDTTDPHRRFTKAELATLAALVPLAALRIHHARLVEQHVESQRLAAIGQTVAGLAHCVKNILNGIQGGAYILDRALAQGETDRLERGWSMVKRNAAFMSDLVLGMLSYARERKPVLEAVDPRGLLESIRDLAAMRADENAVPVACEVDQAVETITVDSTAMKRCLLNLAVNAVEACQAAGEQGAGGVTLRCAPGPGGKTVCLTVADRGCGIPQEHLDRLFTMFFSTKGGKGTGLGLPVCRKIVEEHGGAISVASVPGRGTEFTIDLPWQPGGDTRAPTV